MKKFKCPMCSKKFPKKKRILPHACKTYFCKQCSIEFEQSMEEEYIEWQKELYEEWQASVRLDLGAAILEQKLNVHLR